MKTINILITTVILLINVDLYSQINVDNVGDVSIGQVIYTKKHNLGYRTIELKSPNWDGGFIIDKSGYNSMSTFRPNTTWYGSLGTSSYHFGVGYIEHIYTWILTNYSDERLKENIENIETPLEKIIKLNGVTYNLKDSNNIELESSEYKDQSFKKKQIGFLAQDLQTVFPDLVFQESDSSEYCINYIGLIPVLVESIKEQQSMLIEQEQKINELTNLCNNKDKQLKSETNTEIFEDNKNQLNAILYQNRPNPFDSKTEILCTIPLNASSAQLFVYNLEGMQLKKIEILDKGVTSIIIDGSALKAGMYLYTLVVDNLEIATKRMILTK